jgi:hypothetical protein
MNMVPPTRGIDSQPPRDALKNKIKKALFCYPDRFNISNPGFLNNPFVFSWLWQEEIVYLVYDQLGKDCVIPVNKGLPWKARICNKIPINRPVKNLY